MKWMSLASGMVAALAATACLAETPEFSSGRAALAPVLPAGRQFGGENWWTRFGEPVNAVALAEVAPAKAAGMEASGPVPLYGDGYIFGPGSCDCPPPCIYHLWDGYAQHPKRCNPYVPWFHGQCGDCDGGCGNGGCGHCGLGRGCGCGKGCCPSCATKAACGCGQPVSCGCATAVAPSAKQATITPPKPLSEEAALIQLPRIN